MDNEAAIGLIQLGIFCILIGALGILTVQLGRKSEAANRRIQVKKVLIHEGKNHKFLGKIEHTDHWHYVSKADADKYAFAEANKESLADKEWNCREFRAYQECPQCEVQGFWLINWCGQDETTRFIKRECGNCGHIWNQAK